jgi:hypothetical protein
MNLLIRCVLVRNRRNGAWKFLWQRQTRKATRQRQRWSDDESWINLSCNTKYMTRKSQWSHIENYEEILCREMNSLGGNTIFVFNFGPTHILRLPTHLLVQQNSMTFARLSSNYTFPRLILKLSLWTNLFLMMMDSGLIYIREGDTMTFSTTSRRRTVELVRALEKWKFIALKDRNRQQKWNVYISIEHDDNSNLKFQHKIITLWRERNPPQRMCRALV